MKGLRDGKCCIRLLRLYYRMVTKCFSGYGKGSEHNASQVMNVQTALNSKLDVSVHRTLISFGVKHYRKILRAENLLHEEINFRTCSKKKLSTATHIHHLPRPECPTDRTLQTGSTEDGIKCIHLSTADGQDRLVKEKSSSPQSR